MEQCLLYQEEFEDQAFGESQAAWKKGSKEGGRRRRRGCFKITLLHGKYIQKSLPENQSHSSADPL